MMELKMSLEVAENIKKLPDRAISLLIMLISKDKKYTEYVKGACYKSKFDYSQCESPMEIIFNLAFDIVVFDQRFRNQYRLLPQYEIATDNADYRVDFLVQKYVDNKWENTDLVIEIDGQEFHEKTKEQVAHDRDREYDLKLAGYDVLRFSGSQVYIIPCNYANRALTYISAEELW